MRGVVFCSLLTAGLVFMYTHMNHENVQLMDQPAAALSHSSGSGKKDGHKHPVSTVAPEQQGSVYISIIAEPKGYESRYGELPPALRGTRMDGDLLADADGKLIIHASIRKRFDYFFSAASEEGLETAIGRIEENILHTLPPEAADEALGVLNSYLNYKKGLQDYLKGTIDFPENSDQVEGLRIIMEKRKELRRKYMEPHVVDSFFGDQELYDEFSLKRLEIHYDQSMTIEEKQDELIRIEQTLPEKYRS